MLMYAIYAASVMIALSMILVIGRLVIGPTRADRVLALDTLGINGIGIVVLMGINYGLSDYFEAALLLAMMGFVSTVALCRYLLTGDVID